MDRVTLPQYQLKWGGGFDPSEKKGGEVWSDSCREKQDYGRTFQRKFQRKLEADEVNEGQSHQTGRFKKVH